MLKINIDIDPLWEITLWTLLTLASIARDYALYNRQCWMKKKNHYWKKELKGQYMNGHERKDVVHYC